MNQKTSRYLVAAVGLLALVVGQAAPASAVPFAFSQSTGWELGTATTRLTLGMSPDAGGVEFFGPSVNPNPALFLGNNLPPANTYTTIGWGCLNADPLTCAADGNNVVLLDPRLNPGRSSAFLLGLAGTVDTADGVWQNISYLEHKNQPIFGRTLATVQIESILRIDTTPDTSDDQTINVSFTETLNSGTCPPPNPQGSACDDFFSFDPTAFAPLIITDNGTDYLVEFRPFNLVNASFDSATGTIFTAESTTSSLNVQMRIVPTQVPEPVTVILLGAGLLGFGVFATARRRSR